MLDRIEETEKWKIKKMAICFDVNSVENSEKKTIKIKDIVDENFQDYKKSSMMIATEKCDFKCFKELGLSADICQNMSIMKKRSMDVSFELILRRYKLNPITKAIVIGGLEPMLQFEEVYGLIKYFRKNGCEDDFVIYTGYYKEEISEKILKLKIFNNIIIKFGRFIPNCEKIYDKVLGIYLSSNNQYAEKIC